MPIAVECQCGIKLQVKDNLAGRRGKCPSCGNVFQIPAAPAADDPLGSLGADDPLGVGGGLDLGGLEEPGGSADPFGGALEGADSALGGVEGQQPDWAAGQPAMPAGGMAAAGQPAARGQESTTSKKLIFIVCGGAALAVLLTLGGLVAAIIFSDRGEVARSDDGGTPPPVEPAPPTPVEETPVETPPETPSLLLQPSQEELTLAPGESTFVEVAATLENRRMKFVLSFSEPPENVTAKAFDFHPDRGTVRLDVAVAPGAPEGESTLQLVGQSDAAEAQFALPIVIRNPPTPELLPLSRVSLSPGEKRKVEIGLERNGFEGPIELALEALPKGVTATPATIAADSTSSSVEVSAADSVAEGAAQVKVIAVAGMQRVETELPLQVEKFAFQTAPLAFPVVWIEPGTTEAVDVKVVRKSYQGPLEISAEGLPEGVDAGQTEIAAGENAGKLQLTASGEATNRVRSAKLVTRAGGKSSETLLIVRVKSADEVLLPPLKEDLELNVNLLKRGSFGGRLNAEGKQILSDVYGGTKESDAAVREGLYWLVKHQSRDGRWSLKEYDRDARCDCKDAFEADTDDNDTAGTAFGLLPLLAAGVTPTDAPDPELKNYRSNVRAGLAFLIANQKTSNDDKNGELGGGMYAHALGTMALCEAYALTGDDKLQIPAQKAVTYLLKSQHGGTGGWGYGPRQEGDTSVVGWVFLAIRSGQMAGIPIQVSVLDRAQRFLNSTAAGPEGYERSRYCYKPGRPATTTLTAAGLLGRMYLRWPSDEPNLVEGVKFIMQNRPPEYSDRLGPIYYYYYATQVLHHMEEPNWDWWNHLMREHLIRTQEKESHKKGSWSPEFADHGKRGGRLYSTALSLLTLEAYYRHLPLYRRIPKTESGG